MTGGEGSSPSAHMSSVDIIFVSFDDTLPVPALASPFALPRESVINLFHRGRELTQLQWKSDRVLIRPEDNESWEDAEEIPRIEVEEVEFYDFTGSIYEFNSDTEHLRGVGYRAFFVPGGGIVVVENPDVPPVLAATEIIKEIQGNFGTFIPRRLNSWAEYADAVPNLERAFAFAGVERHEREKQELVADMVNDFLFGQAKFAPREGTVQAKELAVNTVLEGTDVRWWSHSPEREVFVVTDVSPAANKMLAVTFSTKYGIEHTRLVRPNRRFLVAEQ